jgi:hypothetical protein
MTKLKILNEVFNKVFVITTPHFEERIQNMKERLSGCEYEFFYGTYGGDIDVESYRKLGSRLTRAQLACALSHRDLCKKIIDDDLDNYHSQLPSDYGVFFLGHDFSGPAGNYFSENLIEVSSGSVAQFHCFNMTRRCAELILEVNKDLLWTADGVSAEVLNRYEIRYYLANPKLAVQDNHGETSTLVAVDIKHGMGL